MSLNGDNFTCKCKQAYNALTDEISVINPLNRFLGSQEQCKSGISREGITQTSYKNKFGNEIRKTEVC